MRKPFFWLGLLLLVVGLPACQSVSKGPDVSSVAVDLQWHRFERDFFQIDTTQIETSLKGLQQKHPGFTGDFLEYVLGAGSADPEAPVVQQAAAAFLRSYRGVHTDLEKQYATTSKLEGDFKRAFQHIRYYHPQYQVPAIYTYVGPFDAPAVALTQGGLAIGLQLFAGKDYPFYTSPQGQLLYPAYISRRFESAYMVPTAALAIAQDLFPEPKGSLPLVEQMIEKGKYWYLLRKWLPEVSDTLITGYTGTQMKWAQENEGMIWNFLLQQNHVYTTDPSLLQLYIGEAPQTQGFPEASPGNIGPWIGWRILQAYEKKKGESKPDELMRTPAKSILAEAKYKPR